MGVEGVVLTPCRGMLNQVHADQIPNRYPGAKIPKSPNTKWDSYLTKLHYPEKNSTFLLQQ